jgi:hypothetical protein
MSLTKVSYSMITGAVANVLDYGADPTGATSSQAAFVAAFASGNAIYVPRGTFLVTGNLILPYGKVMFGDGPMLSVIQCDTSAFSGVCLTVNGRSRIHDFSVTAINAASPKTATGIYFTDTDSIYNFTGHSSATNIYVNGFNVGIQVNNFFDLNFELIESFDNGRGFEVMPNYSPSFDSGYYTTITLLKCYIAFNDLEGFYASSTINGRVLHFIDSVFEFNCANVSVATAEVSITRCFQVNFTSCHSESSAGNTKPWLLLNDVSDCLINSHYATGTQGVSIGETTGQLTVLNSTIGNLVGATGASSQNIYTVGSNIQTKTVINTVTQRYISTTLNGTYQKDLCINNQLKLTNDLSLNSSYLNEFKMFTKTVTATIGAGASVSLISDYYSPSVFSGDVVALASITNLYNPGLILTVTPATTGSKEYFCVLATNTSASSITVTSAQLKVVFFAGSGMAI